jgi:hypothetical protein
LERKFKNQQVTNPNAKYRHFQWKYYLSVERHKTKVCRKFLLKILQISEMRLRTAQNFKKTGQPVRERRGTHTNRPHKISADIWEMVTTHWGLYPHKETHYGRKSNRKYFENPCLNVKILYEGFKEYYFDEIGFHLKMKYCTYHRYFRENSVYSFRQPRTDVCDFCAQSKVLLESNPEDPCKLKYELHKKKVETYNSLKHDLISDPQNNSKKDSGPYDFPFVKTFINASLSK